MTTNRQNEFAAFLQKYHLSHPLLALAKMLPFMGLAFVWAPAVFLGVVYAIAFYHGREVAHVGSALPNNKWYEGYLFSKWKSDNHKDFWPVVPITLIVGIALYSTI